MAIPFHTPSEYGPVPLPNHNLPQDTNNNNNNNDNYVDLRNQRNRAQPNVRHHNNHLPLNNPQPNAQQLQIGFIRQLFQELLHFYDQYSTMGTQQVRPERDPLAAPPANRPFQHQQDQINQTSAGAGPSTPPRSPRLPLPDIIQCHAQLAFNFCATATNNNNFSSNRNNNELPLPGVRVPLPPPPQQFFDESSDEESLDMSLKIGFEIYRKTGRDLREIADDLERNYNRDDRRRSFRRSRLRLSLDMDLKLASAALAILGGVGYYFSRR